MFNGRNRLNQQTILVDFSTFAAFHSTNNGLFLTALWCTKIDTVLFRLETLGIIKMINSLIFRRVLLHFFKCSTLFFNLIEICLFRYFELFFLDWHSLLRSGAALKEESMLFCLINVYKIRFVLSYLYPINPYFKILFSRIMQELKSI